MDTDYTHIPAASRIVIANRNIEMYKNTIWEATVNVEAAEIVHNEQMKATNTENIRQSIALIKIWRERLEAAEAELKAPVATPNGQAVA